jgi:hypothetical protein
VAKPDDLNALAETEKGSVLDNYTFADVELSLKVLILCASVAKTVKLLADEGIVITKNQLVHWRDSAFSSRYIELRSELAPQLSEEVAARALERAIQADDAEALYIAAAADKIDDVSPDKLAASVLALAKAKGENITKAQLLRDRPTEIRGSTDTSELLEVLRKHGVLAHDPRTHEDLVVDAEVVEEPEPEEDALKAQIRAKLSAST